MFNVKVLKAPSRNTNDVMGVFQKTINELGEVSKSHTEYADKQREVAEAATREADAAQREAAKADNAVKALNAAIGNVTAEEPAL